jgi:hypothetical protein
MPRQAVGQFHLTYESLADALTKFQAKETGEAFQCIIDSTSFKLAHRSMPMKGTLRILKTDGSNSLSYIPINRWIYSGSYPTIIGTGRISFRDTVTYDSLGNIIKSVSYTGKNNKFKLHDRTISQYKDSLYIEYREYLKDNKVRRSFSNRIADFNIPQAYDNKTKVLIEMRKNYKNGKIKVKQTYDTNGKLITSEKYKR